MGNILSAEPDDDDEPNGNGKDMDDMGVFKVQDHLLKQERCVAEMETSSLLLDEYQTQLDGIANQSMLLLGFVMATIGVETLGNSGDVSGGFCFSKSPAHFWLTWCLFVTTELCICYSLLCICACAYASHMGRHAFLHIGWLISVHRTEKSLRRIYLWYSAAGVNFVLSLLFLIWLFVGINHLPPAPDSADRDSDAVVVTRNDNVLLVGCFDPADDAALEHHNRYGLGLAITFTCVMVIMAGYMRYSFKKAKESYARDQAEPHFLLLRRRKVVNRMKWHTSERLVGSTKRDLQEMNDERQELLLDNPGLLTSEQQPGSAFYEDLLQQLAERLGVRAAGDVGCCARPQAAQQPEPLAAFREILLEHGLGAAKRWWEAELLNEQLDVCGKTSDKSHEDIRTAFGKAGSEQMWKKTQDEVATAYRERVSYERYVQAAPRAIVFREKRPRFAGRLSKVLHRKTPGDVARRIEAKKTFDAKVEEGLQHGAAPAAPPAATKKTPSQKLQELENRREVLQKKLETSQREATRAREQWQSAVDEEKVRKYSERISRKEARRELKAKERIPRGGSIGIRPGSGDPADPGLGRL